MLSRSTGGAVSVIKLGEVVMILDLHRQGLSVSAIARESGLDRKTVRRYIARGLEPPAYGPRQPRPTLLDPFTSLSARAGEGLSRPDGNPAAAGAEGARLHGRLHSGDGLSAGGPAGRRSWFEVRFETPPGEQGQVDFAQFRVVFTDEPTMLAGRVAVLHGAGL